MWIDVGHHEWVFHWTGVFVKAHSFRVPSSTPCWSVAWLRPTKLKTRSSRHGETHGKTMWNDRHGFNGLCHGYNMKLRGLWGLGCEPGWEEGEEDQHCGSTVEVPRMARSPRMSWSVCWWTTQNRTTSAVGAWKGEAKRYIRSLILGESSVAKCCIFLIFLFSIQRGSCVHGGFLLPELGFLFVEAPCTSCCFWLPKGIPTFPMAALRNHKYVVPLFNNLLTP